MIYTWLTQNTSDHLLVFYNGWGMDEGIVRDIDPSGYDICTCHDFRDIPDSIPEAWAGYNNVTVVAWSLGVLAANIHLSNARLKIFNSIAINGTIAPINDLYGIPVDTYWKTLHGLTETSRGKFCRRMCGDKTSYERFLGLQSHRDMNEQKEELVAFTHHILNSENIHPSWRYIIAGKKDKIFPYKNQQDFWNQHHQVTTRELELPHFPFFYWNSWNGLITAAISSQQEIHE